MTYDEMLAMERNCKSIRKRPGSEEHDIQVACCDYFAITYPEYKGLLIAVPNGGRRDKVTGARLKAEGVVPGVADLLLFIAAKGYHMLAIEIKTPKGRQQPSQAEWQRKIEAQGYKYVVCHSVDEFIAEIKEYLDIT
jgi:hypothetical protein